MPFLFNDLVQSYISIGFRPPLRPVIVLLAKQLCFGEDFGV